MRVAAVVCLAVGVSCHGQADVSQPAPQPKPKPAAVPTPPEPVKPAEPATPPPPPPTTVTHVAPGGIEETCQLLVEFPYKPPDVVADPKEMRWYRKDDFEEIADLCKMSLYAPETTDTVTAVGVCPKTHWSTPALEVHAIDQVGMKKADFEKSRCRKDRRYRGAKKVAKFKVAVYDKEPESGRMYFHYSRLLGINAYMVPVTYRTISRREIKRWATTAISTLTSRTLARMNPLEGWSVLNWRHRKGGDVIAGSFYENARGEDDFRAFSYSRPEVRIAVIWQFRGRPYYNIAASKKPLSEQMTFDTEHPRKFDQQLQLLAQAQDFTHMMILDHLFNQRDRGGNINARTRYHYLDDQKHLRWKKTVGKDDDEATMVPLERLLLKDNDDGLRWDKFGLLNASLIIDDIKHIDSLAYARIQWLAKVMTDPATRDGVKTYFIEEVRVSPKSYDDVRLRLIDLAARFARKYADGKLLLDLDLEPVLAMRPPNRDAVARKPGKQ